jgi:hypothetical protein
MGEVNGGCGGNYTSAIDVMAAPGIAGRGLFIGFFDRITSPRDRETGLRNKRLRENPRQNKAFPAL